MTSLVEAPRALTVFSPVEEHPVAVYLAKLAPSSRRTMRESLGIIADIASGGRHDILSLDWAALRYQHCTAIRAVLAERYSPATANRHLAALRRTLKEAWRLGQMTAEDYHRAVDLEPVRGSRLPKGRALSASEITALLEACARDRTAAGARDAALIAVLRVTAIRRAEASALNLEDYTEATGELRIIAGKGNKGRRVFVGAARAHLADWLAVRGTHPGPLFCPVRKGGRVLPGGMTDQSVYAALRKREREARVEHFTPHDMRRTAISDLFDVGVDPATIQALAGHASLTTTGAYDRRGEARKQRAAAQLHVPYFPRADR